MKDKFKNIIKLISAFILFFLMGSLITDIFAMFGINVSTFNTKDYSYFEALLEGCLVLVVYLLYRKTLNEDFQKFKDNKKYLVNELFKYFALFFIVKIASAAVTSIIGEIIGVSIGESENQNTIIDMAKSAPIMMLISTSILAPFVEEGIFRVAIRKVIKNNHIFIIISGLIFGFMHIFPTDLSIAVALTYSITYVTMGVLLAYIYVETDNIWINIIIHALNNLLSMLAILFLM